MNIKNLAKYINLDIANLVNLDMDYSAYSKDIADNID